MADERVGTTQRPLAWVAVQTLSPEGGSPTGDFGSAVSISGDYAIVGAASADESLSAAYVYERDANGRWMQVQRLVPSGEQEAEFFGASVAISSRYAVVGAPGPAPTGWIPGSPGAVHVFERTDGTGWVPYAIIAWNPTFPHLGESVGVSGDHIVAGGWFWEQYDLDFWDSHQAAYAFKLDGAGSWSWSATLFQKEGLAPWFRGFNGAVAISDRYALAGWLLFERETSTEWNQVSALAPAHASYVRGIDIADRRAIIGVGLTEDDGSGYDGIFVYELDSAGTWFLADRLEPTNGLSSSMGRSLGISNSNAIVSASDTDPQAPVRLFARVGTTWMQRQTLLPDGSGSGMRVDISGGTAIVSGLGTAYVFEDACRNLPDGSDCDDGLDCTGTETCLAGVCVSSGGDCSPNLGDADSDASGNSSPNPSDASGDSRSNLGDLNGVTGGACTTPGRTPSAPALPWTMLGLAGVACRRRKRL
ncbi:MAG: FG-GAP repeat protein [Deltaproteobacteria bacterium]|jgi:hypothetical protein|nr:FG-GAP repeat protein [Deltaproteobacteria bacterium]MBW2536888.1 FG-GAP repeat protein [Deltaproteobacteria bacterium]